MSNLYELNSQIEKLESAEDIDPQVLSDTLESLTLTRDSKLANIAHWILNNKATMDGLDDRIKAMQKRKKVLVNLNNRLNDYITTALDSADIKKLETEDVLLSPRSFKAKVVIPDETKLTADYVTRKTEYKPNKVKIYADLMANKVVNGAILQPNRKTVIK